MSYGRKKAECEVFQNLRKYLLLPQGQRECEKVDSWSNEGIFLGYSFASKAYWIYNKRTMKVMKTVNVVIDESSNSSFEKGIKELPKEILPPEPKEVHEIIEQEPASPSIPGTPSVLEDSVDIPTSPDSESHEEK